MAYIFVLNVMKPNRIYINTVVHLKITMYPAARIWFEPKAGFFIGDENAWIMVFRHKRQKREFKYS